MNILLTGATGFLGSHIAKFLWGLGYSVTGVGRGTPESNRDITPFLDRFISANLSETKDYLKLEKQKIDAVVHTVSLSQSESEKDFRQCLLTNVFPTGKLLELAAHAGSRTFCYLSTQQVYGTNSVGKVDEKTKTAPTNHYALSHLMSEELTLHEAAKHGLRPIILRISNSYGAPLFPKADFWRPFVNQFCKMAIDDGKIQLKGDGTERRDVIHVNDVLGALHHLLTEEKAKGIFNVGSGVTQTVLETAQKVANEISHATGKTIPVLMGKDRAGWGTKEFVYSIQNLKKMGFQPELSFQKGLERMVAELLQEKRKAA